MKLIIFIFVGLLGLASLWLIGKFNQEQKNGEEKPFWSGTDMLQVCKAPYYSSKECSDREVKLLAENSAQIKFTGGNFLVTRNVKCFYTTSNNSRYVFCRSWDRENNQWDFFPLSANF